MRLGRNVREWFSANMLVDVGAGSFGAHAW